MLENPILFDKSQMYQENDNFWILELWNGWLFAIPKNQTAFRRSKFYLQYETEIRPIELYVQNPDSQDCFVDTTVVKIASMSLAYCFAKGIDESVSWCISLQGVVCYGESLELVMRHLL